MWTLMALLACHGEKSVTLDSTGDTGLRWETGLPDDTADTDSADTADTGDTGATGWVAVEAAPDGLVVNPGATWGLRLSAQSESGVWTSLDASWTSSAPDVVSVDETDVATAVAVGTATLTGQVAGLSATATVEVRDDGLLSVTVLDASTGELLPGASVVIDDGERLVDEDSDGVISATVTTSAGLAVTVYLRDYVPVTVWNTVGRVLRVPLTSQDALVAPRGALAGGVDLSAIAEGEFGNVRVGMAVASVQGPALLLDPGALISTDRTVDIYGVEASLPENLYIGGIVEDYSVPADPGPAAVWTMAGPLPVAEVTAGLSSTGDVLELLRTYRDSLSWGYSEGGTVIADETLSADLAPATALDLSLAVDVGELPLGFSGDEEVLVLTGQELSAQGFVVTGFGLGNGVVDVAAADVDLAGAESSRVLAIAEVGGLGEGGALCASVVDLDGAAIVTPTLPEPPAISFDGATRTFALSTDGGADFVRARISSRDGTVRELLLDGGAAAGILPVAGIPFSYGSTTWELIGLHTGHDTFEGALAEGATDIDAMAEVATASARFTGKF